MTAAAAPPITLSPAVLAQLMATAQEAIQAARAALEAADRAHDAARVYLATHQPPRPAAPPQATDDPDTCAHPHASTIDTFGGRVLLCPDCGYESRS